jgi:hypothetical protein
MKNALPYVARILLLAESNPALFVIVASLSVPLALIYAALSYVAAPAGNLVAFLVLSALALAYCGWIARLVVMHWHAEAAEPPERQKRQLTPRENRSDSGSPAKEAPAIGV